MLLHKTTESKIEFSITWQLYRWNTQIVKVEIFPSPLWLLVFQKSRFVLNITALIFCRSIVQRHYVCDFVRGFGRSRLNKKWNDKAAVPYLLHIRHLKAEQRGNLCVCVTITRLCSEQLCTKCLWFLLLLYLFIHLFICSLVSGITSE